MNSVRALDALCLAAPRARARGDRILKRRLGSLLIPGGKRQPGRAVLHGLAYWRKAVERAEKREFVTELNEVFKASGSVVVAHYAGVTVAQMNDFRSKMRAA